MINRQLSSLAPAFGATATGAQVAVAASSPPKVGLQVAVTPAARSPHASEVQGQCVADSDLVATLIADIHTDHARLKHTEVDMT